MQPSVLSVARRPTAAAKLRGLVLLPHPGPIAVVLAVTAGFAVLAPGPAPSALDWVLLLGAMLGGQLAIGAVNELVDAPDDAAGKPWKPIPAGLVGIPTAKTLVAIGLVAMVAGSAAFGLWSLVLCAVGTGAGLAYDLWLKRTTLSWLPYLVALPLIPIWVWVALDAFDAALLALYPLGTLATFAVHLSQSLPDVAADQAAGIRNTTTVLGQRRSLALCWASLAASSLLAFTTAGPSGASTAVVTASAVIAVGLVALDAVLFALAPALGVRACFPCVAIGTAALGLGWVVALG